MKTKKEIKREIKRLETAKTFTDWKMPSRYADVLSAKITALKWVLDKESE